MNVQANSMHRFVRFVRTSGRCHGVQVLVLITSCASKQVHRYIRKGGVKQCAEGPDKRTNQTH